MLISAANSTKFRPFGSLGTHDEPNSDSVENAGQTKCSNKTRKILCGLVLMVLISISWAGALYLLKISFQRKRKAIDPYYLQQTINYTDDPTKVTKPTEYTVKEEFEIVFDAPLFTTWYISVWNVLFLPIFLISHLCCCNKEHDSPRKIFVESIQGFMEKGFSLLQFFGRCGSFCLLWVLTNYMLIFSLRLLDTTVVMALFSCSVSIVYLLSWVVLHQQFVGIRIVALIICNTGMALLVYMDGVRNKTLGAVTVGFGSAIGAAIYKVFFKRMIGYTTFAQMSMFFTFVGLMNALIMWPMFLLLYLVGAETIVWSQIPWETLSGSALLLLTANIIGNFGIEWTYELFLNLGIFCAIPLASLIDTFIYKSVFQDMKLGGVLLILFGFIVVLLPDNWNEYLGDLLRHRLAKWKRREQMKKNGRVQDTTTGQLSRLRTNSGRVK